MLRNTLLSLLLGIGASIALLGLVFPPESELDAGDGALVVEGSELVVLVGEQSSQSGTRSFAFNEEGLAFLALPVDRGALYRYPFINLRFIEFPAEMEVAISWRKQATSETYDAHVIETRARRSNWIATSELPGWGGELSSMTILLSGKPGDSVSIDAIVFHPPALRAQLAALLNDWTSFAPWQRDSMNNYDGATKISQFYPAPVVATLLALTLVSYVLLVIIRYRRLAIDWRVVGLLALVYWLALDLPWQYTLLRQVGETREQFAGKPDQQKLAAGPDAAIYQAVSEALEKIEEEDARVFVASSDSYIGLRAAYYFYPHNVFWHLRGPQLPYKRYMRNGDYIFLAHPTAMKLTPEKNRLVRKWVRYDVDILTNSESGSLLRLRLP